MAARLEGRKFETTSMVGAKIGDSLYRVDRFRRFLPNRGSDGKGLIQFWGLRATRTYVAGEPKPEWEVVGKRRLHTVNVGDVMRLR